MIKQLKFFFGPVLIHKPMHFLAIILIMSGSLLVLSQTSNILYAYILACGMSMMMVGSLFYYVEDKFEKKQPPTNETDEKEPVEKLD